MKGKVCVLFSVLIAICMICSCGGGSGSGSDSSAQKAVAVGFNVEINDSASRILSVTGNDYSDIEIWYRALPQWTSTDGFKIQGDTRENSARDASNFVKLTVIDAQTPANNKFTYDKPYGTVGYFAQGQWLFDIEVRKPQTTGAAAVLWKTAAAGVPKTINSLDLTEGKKNLEFEVAKNIDTSKSGKVTFNVSTNKKSTTDFYEVSYSSLGSTTSTPVTTLTQTGKGNVTADYVTLTGDISLSSGFYAITVKYYSAASTLVGLSTVAAEVIPGGTITVSGTIENQEYQNTAFKINDMYKLGLTVAASKITGETTVGVEDLATVAVGTPITFTASPELQDLAGNAVTGVSKTYYYCWNGGATATGENPEKFTYTPAAPGAFYVNCIVYYKSGNTVVGSASSTFKFIAE